ATDAAVAAQETEVKTAQRPAIPTPASDAGEAGTGNRSGRGRRGRGRGRRNEEQVKPLDDATTDTGVHGEGGLRAADRVAENAASMPVAAAVAASQATQEAPAAQHRADAITPASVAEDEGSEDQNQDSSAPVGEDADQMEPERKRRRRRSRRGRRSGENSEATTASAGDTDAFADEADEQVSTTDST